MAPPCPPATIPRGHGLGEQEHGPVQLQVAVVVGGGVLQERQRPEHAGGVDQQGGVGVLAGQAGLHLVQLRGVAQVGRDAPGGTGHGQLRHGLLDPVLAATDDDRAAAGGDDVGGDVPAHAAAAADHHELAVGELLCHLPSPHVTYLLVGWLIGHADAHPAGGDR